jgi:RNA polymerase sigma-70 factor (ECF subfamily)
MEADPSDVGELDEFERLFVLEYPVIFRSAYLIVGDRDLAGEITQEAFCRLLMRWNRIRRYDRPGAWVRLVAVRLARRSRDRRVVEASEVFVGNAMPDDPLADRLILEAAVLQLPRAQRVAVVLHYLDDLPIADVAAALGCRPSTARVHLHRARTRLAELLGEAVRDDA